MKKLYLALKKSFTTQVSQGHLPNIYFDWEQNQLGKYITGDNKVPIALFNVNHITYKNPFDRYPIGKMEITLKVIFYKKLNDIDLNDHNLENLRKIEALLKAVETDETGRLSIVRIEANSISAYQDCFQYTLSSLYYPPLEKKRLKIYTRETNLRSISME